MNPIKRRLFFDSEGHIFFELNLYGETTVEKDISDFKALSERNRETFDVLELPFGAFAQDFAECGGYRVNPTTKELEFAPKPTTPEEPLIFGKPFSEQILELKQSQVATNRAVDETSTTQQELLELLMETGVIS